MFITCRPALVLEKCTGRSNYRSVIRSVAGDAEKFRLKSKLYFNLKKLFQRTVELLQILSCTVKPPRVSSLSPSFYQVLPRLRKYVYLLLDVP